MAWNKQFTGTRSQIISQINLEDFPPEAHPLHAVRQFIGAQLPEADEEPQRVYIVTCAGHAEVDSSSRRMAQLLVSVKDGGIYVEPDPKEGKEKEGVQSGNKP